MNTTEAINALVRQTRQIEILRQFTPFTKEFIKWFSDTLLLLEDIFGKSSQVYRGFTSINWEYSDSFEYVKGHREARLSALNQASYEQGFNFAEGILQSGIDLLKRKGIDKVYEGRNTPKEASETLKVEYIVENNLRKAIRQKPLKESEINDALETLFIGASLDFTREKEHIIYSSKTYKPDFIFKQISTTVETKLCDRTGRDKEIIAEINDDILAYKTKYSNLIFVIYDSNGIIRNVDEFKGSIERQESVVVKVIKH